MAKRLLLFFSVDHGVSNATVSAPTTRGRAAIQAPASRLNPGAFLAYQAQSVL